MFIKQDMCRSVDSRGMGRLAVLGFRWVTPPLPLLLPVTPAAGPKFSSVSEESSYSDSTRKRQQKTLNPTPSRPGHGAWHRERVEMQE